MSFDLFFCSRKKERVDFTSVPDWCVRLDNFTRKNQQVWYSNPDTGVYFSFDFCSDGSFEGDESPIPAGWFDTGRAFNLNFLRPSFFGHEAMPIVEQLCARFGLSIFDNQEDTLLTNPTGNDLLNSWLKHNRIAIQVFSKVPDSRPPLHMSPSTSIYLWSYLKQKKALESVFDAGDVFVPTLVPARKKDRHEVATAVVITQGVPTIVPQSNWVIVVRGKRGFFKSSKQSEVGVISRVTFEELFGQHCTKFEWEPPVRLISPEHALLIAKKFHGVDFSFTRDDFEIVGLDGFVDVDLPPKAT